MHFDELLHIIGGFGPYQKVRLFLICLVGIVCAFHSMNMVFVGAKPTFQCKISKINLTDERFENISFQDWATFLRKGGEQCSIYSPTQASESVLTGDLIIDGPNITGTSPLSTEPCTEWEYSQDVYGPTIVSNVSNTG